MIFVVHPWALVLLSGLGFNILCKIYCISLYGGLMKLSLIHEMASLSGWEPTRELQYTVSVDGEEIDYVSAESPEEAVERFKKQFPGYEGEITASLENRSDGDTSFTAADIKSINNDSTRQQIEKWLNDNKTPYSWIIRFGKQNSPIRVKPTPGAITFMKSGNVGGDTLTPHMVIHTIGHAVVNYDDTLCDIFVKFLGPIAGSGGRDGARYASERDRDHDSVLIPACKLLHMRAAKITVQGGKRGFPSLDELVNEVMAIYIKNGSVTVRPNELCDFKISSDVCNALQQAIHDYCKGRLDGCVGKVVYDD